MRDSLDDFNDDEDLLDFGDEEDLLDFGLNDDGDWELPDDEINAEHVYPAGYCIEFADQAYKQCLLYGATDKQLAEFFSVEEDEIRKWRNTVPAFAKAVINGKDIADAEVAHSLYQRAIGAKHPEYRVVSYLGDARIVRIVKHYPPETAAGQFWLTTRQRDTWGRDALGIPANERGIQLFYPDDWDEDDIEDLTKPEQEEF